MLEKVINELQQLDDTLEVIIGKDKVILKSDAKSKRAEVNIKDGILKALIQCSFKFGYAELKKSNSNYKTVVCTRCCSSQILYNGMDFECNKCECVNYKEAN